MTPEGLRARARTLDDMLAADPAQALARPLFGALSAVKDNIDVKGLHEFVQALPGVQPMPCVNAGTGRAVDAAEWVRWANRKMGYNARYWEIGNELGGGWEPGTFLPFDKGRLTAEMYTRRYNDIANAMREVERTPHVSFTDSMAAACTRVTTSIGECHSEAKTS